jgi:hypothetical protein
VFIDESGLSRAIVAFYTPENEIPSGFVEIEGDPIPGYPGGDQDLLTDYYGTFTPRFAMRELRGSSERSTVEHEHTSVFIHPIPNTNLPEIVLSAEAYVNYKGIQDIPVAEIPVSEGSTYIVFSEPVVGNRFQLVVELSAGGCYIPEISTIFRSRDERQLSESYPESGIEGILQQGLVVHLSRVNAIRNQAAATATDAIGQHIPGTAIGSRFLGFYTEEAT